MQSSDTSMSIQKPFLCSAPFKFCPSSLLVASTFNYLPAQHVRMVFLCFLMGFSYKPWLPYPLVRLSPPQLFIHHGSRKNAASTKLLTAGNRVDICLLFEKQRAKCLIDHLEAEAPWTPQKFQRHDAPFLHWSVQCTLPAGIINAASQLRLRLQCSSETPR
jgi:hypothetical protein